MKGAMFALHIKQLSQQNARYRFRDKESRVSIFGLGFGVQSSGFRVQGSGVKV
jgi:hypothetical protein